VAREIAATRDVEIGQVNRHDLDSCRYAASLHISEIHFGLLPLLGGSFMTRLYHAIAQAPQSGVWIARAGGCAVGFLAGCANVGELYRYVIRREAVPLALAGGAALLRPTVLRRMPAVLAYPMRRTDEGGPRTATSSAELLAIAVQRDAQGNGVGKALVGHFERFLGNAGIREYHVATNIEDAGSNAFYRAAGFQPAGTMRHHALTLLQYEKSLW
jgi:ribosomal protein S18 acetylase RimI-like enzyme